MMWILSSFLCLKVPAGLLLHLQEIQGKPDCTSDAVQDWDLPTVSPPGREGYGMK